MPTARVGLAVASSSTTIFAIGGWNGSNVELNTLEAFDTTPQTWNANLRGMPTARVGLVAGVIGDFLYAAGGYNQRKLNVVEKYQISTNEWSTVVPMHFNRHLACAAVLDGKFYAIGGANGLFSYHSSAEVYTPSTNTWSRIADMSTGRYGCGAAVLSGLIYVFAGYDSTLMDLVEVYNSTTDSWHTLHAKMKVTRKSFGIATILDA